VRYCIKDKQLIAKQTLANYEISLHSSKGFFNFMNTIIYKTHFELMNTLTDAQAGLLIKAIGIYCSGVMPTFNDQLVQGIFLGLRHDFDTQAENYEKKVKANRENGKSGGRPKKPTITEDNPQNPMGYLETEETQPNPQNLKDKDKDKDKDIEKDIANSTGSILTNKIARQDNLSEILDNIFGNEK
jgi:hypothetical protein